MTIREDSDIKIFSSEKNKNQDGGIQLITKTPMTGRNLSIVSVALGVGYGMGSNAGILANAPQLLQLIIGMYLY